jgi:hypothetical protein
VTSTRNKIICCRVINITMIAVRVLLGESMHKIKFVLMTGMIIWFGFTSSPMACSVCRCGDNAFQFADQALPLSKQSDAGRFRLSLANSYSSKSNALSPDEGPGTEQQLEFRPSIKAVYQLSRNLAISSELPFSFRRITVTNDQGVQRQRSYGIGDAELTTLWMTNFASANGRYYSAGLSVDLKIPTGQNKAHTSGVRADEHLQSGTGTFDVVVGGAISRSSCASRLFVSAYFRRNGTNDFAYHYGNATLVNLGIQRSFSQSVIGSLQLNGRRASRDVDNDVAANNTGGAVAYISPGVRIGIGNTTSLSLSIQVPIWQSLYGNQNEKSVLVTGIGINL